MMNLMIYFQARCQTRIQTKLTNYIPICQIITLFSCIESTSDLRRPLLVDELRASYVKSVISSPNTSPLSARDLIFQFPLLDTWWWCCVILITFCSGFILSVVFHRHILLKLDHYDLRHDVLAMCWHPTWLQSQASCCWPVSILYSIAILQIITSRDWPRSVIARGW